MGVAVSITLPTGTWECSECSTFNPATTQVCLYCNKPKAEIGFSGAAFEACTEEAKLHDEIIKKLKALNWPYLHSRMDMPTTVKRGAPDFVIAAPMGKTLWVECKSKTGKMELDQTGFGMSLLKQSHRWYVVRSMDEFNAVLERNL